MMTTPTITYAAWSDARGAWIGDKAALRRYRFPCLGCGRMVEATTDEMRAAAERAGLCACCDDVERAMYRTATPDGFLLRPERGDA